MLCGVLRNFYDFPQLNLIFSEREFYLSDDNTQTLSKPKPLKHNYSTSPALPCT